MTALNLVAGYNPPPCPPDSGLTSEDGCTAMAWPSDWTEPMAKALMIAYPAITAISWCILPYIEGSVWGGTVVSPRSVDFQLTRGLGVSLYSEVAFTLDLTIPPVTPVLTLDGPVSGVTHNNYTYDGYLMDDSGNPLADQPVKLYVDGMWHQRTNTDVNGYFKFIYRFTKGGTRNVEVLFPGSDIDTITGIVAPPTQGVLPGSYVWVQCNDGSEHHIYELVEGAWVRTADSGCVPEAQWGKCHPSSQVLRDCRDYGGTLMGGIHYNCQTASYRTPPGLRWTAEMENCVDRPIPPDDPQCLSGDGMWSDCGGFQRLDKTCANYVWKNTNAVCPTASPLIPFTNEVIGSGYLQNGRISELGNLSAFVCHEDYYAHRPHLIMVDKSLGTVDNYTVPGIATNDSARQVALSTPSEIYITFQSGIIRRYALVDGTLLETGSWTVSGDPQGMARLNSGSLAVVTSTTQTPEHTFYLLKSDGGLYSQVVPFATTDGIRHGRGHQMILHPDGTVWFLYHRDSFHTIGAVHFIEQATDFQILSNREIMNDGIYGEDPTFSAVADPVTSKVLMLFMDMEWFNIEWPDGVSDNIGYPRMSEIDSSEGIVSNRSDSFFVDWWQGLGALVTPDGRRRMVFYAVQSDTYQKLYVSEFYNGKWCTPQYILNSVSDYPFAQDQAQASMIVSGSNEFVVRAADGMLHYVRLQ